MAIDLHDTVQRIQDEEYTFPYHYITRYEEGGFTQHFNDSWGISYVSTIEFLLKKIASFSPASVVDIGCGDGRFTRELACHFNPGRLYGIDYSKKAINLACAMNQDKPEIKFVAYDITQSWDQEGFDAVVLMEVLEHIPINSVPLFLKSVRGFLKDSGHLFITVPHVNKPVEEKHYQHFTLSSLEDAVRNDFSIVDTIPFERRGLTRALLTTLLTNRFFLLNNRWLLSRIYKWYKQHLFYCRGEHDCQRIYIEAVAK
jgi:2-polyprenyl-3-methyl-5-hydroxy-6-metoxy-1,4-benzoquinol methylase